MDREPAIRLVVNADHFGASVDVSAGILRAHRDGIVTSTSVLGTIEDPRSEHALLSEHPALGTGIQIVLTGARPASRPEAIPTLTDGNGRFPDSPRELALRWAKAALSLAELEREIDAQVERLRAAGFLLDHINSYLHVGFLPIVAQAMARVAEHRGITCLRSTIEDPNLTWFTDVDRGLSLALLGGLSWFSRKRLGARRHGPKSWGYAESGTLGVMRILEILGRLGPGIHELICHPGLAREEVMTPSGRMRVFDRPAELDALLSPAVRDAVKRRGIALSRFGDLF